MSRPRQTHSLVNIPQELLVIIFEKVDSVTRTKCERVCRRWRDVLRKSPTLQALIKLDFSHLRKPSRREQLDYRDSYEYRVNRDRHDDTVSELIDQAAYCLWKLAEKHGHSVRLVILTDESLGRDPWKVDEKHHRLVGRTVLNHVAALVEAPGRSAYKTGTKLVLHCIQLDYLDGVAPAEGVGALNNTAFSQVILDNVLVSQVILGWSRFVPGATRRGDPSTQFHVPAATMDIRGNDAAFREVCRRLLREHWLDIGQEKRDELVLLLEEAPLLEDRALLNRLVDSIKRNEARFAATRLVDIRSMLYAATADFVESLRAATQAELLAILHELQRDDERPSRDEYVKHRSEESSRESTPDGPGYYNNLGNWVAKYCW